MFIKVFLITIGCLFATGWTQNSVTDIMNAKRKQIGIVEKLKLDEALTLACKIKPNSTKGIIPNDAPDLQEIREFLWNKHVYDVDILVSSLNGTDAEHAVSNAISKNPDFDKTIGDAEYNRIGVYEEPSTTGKKIRIIATKRKIEFEPWFNGEINQYGSGKVEHTLKIVGTSLVGGISYLEGSLQSFDDVENAGSKAVQLGVANKFVISVLVKPEMQNCQLGGVKLFDSHKKMVAFVKF